MAPPARKCRRLICEFLIASSMRSVMACLLSRSDDCRCFSVRAWSAGAAGIFDHEAVLGRPGEDHVLAARPQLRLRGPGDVLLIYGHTVAVLELDDVLGAHAEIRGVGNLALNVVEPTGNVVLRL